MSALAIEKDEMRDLLERIAGHGGSEAERVARAARRLGWLYGRTKRLWYREARRVDTKETEAARAEALRREEASVHAELSALRSRLARLEATIAAAMEDEDGRPGKALRRPLGDRGRMADGAR